MNQTLQMVMICERKSIYEDLRSAHFCLDLLNNFCNCLMHILAVFGFLKHLQPEETSLYSLQILRAVNIISKVPVQENKGSSVLYVVCAITSAGSIQHCTYIPSSTYFYRCIFVHNTSLNLLQRVLLILKSNLQNWLR